MKQSKPYQLLSSELHYRLSEGTHWQVRAGTTFRDFLPITYLSNVHLPLRFIAVIQIINKLDLIQWMLAENNPP